MKYIEETEIGECFCLDNNYYITTSDFKKNGSKLCINLKTGFGLWLSSDSMIDSIDIYILDKDSNIIAIKERQKEHNNAPQQDS